MRFTSSPLSPRTRVLDYAMYGGVVATGFDVDVVVVAVDDSSRPANATDTTVSNTASARYAGRHLRR
jgi:hypothetical protein